MLQLTIGARSPVVKEECCARLTREIDGHAGDRSASAMASASPGTR
jgi:hypothetical protein